MYAFRVSGIYTYWGNSEDVIVFAEIGLIALVLAFLVASAQAILPMIGAARQGARFMAFGDRAAILQFVLVALAFFCLTVSFISSDFSVRLVAAHSHTDKPLLYKISGVWGNHEGSMLLWVLILSVYGALVPVFGKTLPASLKARALSVQGMIGAGFLGFLLFTSNPFERLNPAPINGNSLNPLLQDPGLAFHPPFLYLGYVGFSMAFSFSMAALIEGRVDAVWARWLRPWVLIAWSFLTIGITLGSVWAYYELGWGGWWAWDPVENVSFLPWLIGTALLHSILVLEKRHSMANWTVLLAIAAFSLSLVGTFVVRSGLLTSVHSFAADPKRGVYILMLLLLATGGALSLYALRAHKLRGGGAFDILSKEGSLVLNNIILAIATFAVFFGTFYPLFIEAMTPEKISIGAPYYDRVFAPIMLVLIVVMGAGPLVKWRKDNWKNLRKKLIISLAVFSFIVGVAAAFGMRGLGAGALALAGYLAYSTLASFGRKIGIGKAGVWTRLKAQPSSAYGFLLGHLGMAICMAGITGMSVWAQEDVKVLKIGESVTVGGYNFTLESSEFGEKDNYQRQTATVRAEKKGETISLLTTERRFYPDYGRQGMMTTEAGIQVKAMRNLYVGVGEGNREEGFIVRAYVHVMICWIWLGALMIALAGFVSLLGKRRRP